MCVAAHTYESDKERERERERERFFLLLLFLQHAEEWILHRGGELGDCREELRLLFFYVSSTVMHTKQKQGRTKYVVACRRNEANHTHQSGVSSRFVSPVRCSSSD